MGTKSKTEHEQIMTKILGRVPQTEEILNRNQIDGCIPARKTPTVSRKDKTCKKYYETLEKQRIAKSKKPTALQMTIMKRMVKTGKPIRRTKSVNGTFTGKSFVGRTEFPTTSLHNLERKGMIKKTAEAEYSITAEGKIWVER